MAIVDQAGDDIEEYFLKVNIFKKVQDDKQKNHLNEPHGEDELDEPDELDGFDESLSKKLPNFSSTASPNKLFQKNSGISVNEAQNIETKILDTA